MILTIQGTPDLFLDLEPEVTETAAAGLPLRGSQMDATIRDSDGSGKCDLFLSFSPSVSYRQHPSEVHARAAYEAKNFIGWARLALTYPPKLQKRRKKRNILCRIWTTPDGAAVWMKSCSLRFWRSTIRRYRE